MGLLGMTIEAEYGGSGLGYFEHCIAAEELSKANASLGFSYLVNSHSCLN